MSEQLPLFQRLISSKPNYYACFIIDITLLIGLCVAAITQGNLAWLIPTFIIGLFFATLIEWLIHVYPLHVIKSALSLAHDGHHNDPTGYYNLPFFFSPMNTVIILLITPNSWHTGILYAAMAGMLFGYVVYSIIHHLQHRIRFKSKHLKAMQAHHYIHHKHQDYNFGVTTMIWDKLFNSIYISKSRAS